MSMSLIRVALVDDQPLFSSGLEMIIDAQPDMRSVGTATDGLTAIALQRRELPDVMLMDLRMPVMNGIQSIRAILGEAKDAIKPQLIVLTTIKKDEAVYQALRAGAAAFLTKDATPTEVLRTIRSVHPEEDISGFEDTQDLIRTYGAAGQTSVSSALMEKLTRREREVMLLVVKGLTNAEIAERAFLSAATVKTHVRAILMKLELRSRVQIVVYAYENNVVAPTS